MDDTRFEETSPDLNITWLGTDLYLREGDFRPNQTALDGMGQGWVAERVGFEPTVALQRHAISSRAQSATLASLRGGEGGIRTHDEIAPIPVFETGALNRSATSPRTYNYSRAESSEWLGRRRAGLLRRSCVGGRLPLTLRQAQEEPPSPIPVRAGLASWRGQVGCAGRPLGAEVP